MLRKQTSDWIFHFIGKPVLVGLFAAFVLILVFPEFRNQPGADIEVEETGAQGQLGNWSGPVSYAAAVSRAAPSVVNIYTRKRARANSHPLLNDPFFRRLYNLQQQRIQSSLGSGVIMQGDGFVVTNFHVVDDVDEILVLLYDGREVPAAVVGTDPDTDLAVLKINAKQLQPISVGEPAQAKIGDVVLAIGNPYGVGQTVTQGIVSATGRNGLGLNTFENFIQTDADINPGNSGGPLINQDGKLIGVNSFTGDGEGINFAVAFNEVKAFLASAPEPTPNETIRDCEPQITGEYRSKNDDGDIILYDRDCNDVPDLSIYYPDEKGGDTIIDHDDNEDGSIDGTIVDEGSDSVWDYSLWDSDFDGNWDLEGIHPDGEINPSSLKEIS